MNEERAASMSASSFELSEASHRTLRDLVEKTGRSESEILDAALDVYRRKVFFEGLAADYAALKADPEAWAEELAERKLLESTLMDGLDPDERWTEDGRCLNPESPKERK
jgi:hypothetical protein